MNDPYPPPVPDAPAEEGRGSLAAGFGTGCAVLIIGPLLSWLLIAVAMGVSGNNSSLIGVISLVGGLIPLGLLVGAVVFFMQQGQSRSALGVLVALLAMIALGVLLVAACFGMFAMSGSGWH
jgi:hypothetical protein